MLVASPESESVKQAERFLERLETGGRAGRRDRRQPRAHLARRGAHPVDRSDPADAALLASALAKQEGASFPAARAAHAAINAAARYAALVRATPPTLSALRCTPRRRQLLRVVRSCSATCTT